MKSLVLVVTILFATQGTGSGVKPLRYVPFCEVVGHSDKYDQDFILTAGIMQAGQEFGIFYDPACRPNPDQEDPTLPVLENTREKGAPRERLNRLLESEKRAFVVVEARFDAYNRYKGPLPKDERLQTF